VEDDRRPRRRRPKSLRAHREAGGVLTGRIERIAGDLRRRRTAKCEQRANGARKG
jgi:hypothetical protein